MTTLAAKKELSVTKPVTVSTKVNFLTKLFGDLEKQRFGIVPIALIWTVCWGSIVVGVGGMEHPLLLFFTVVPTMALLSFCLAVQPVRLIIWTGVVATLIDWLLIVLLLLA